MADTKISDLTAATTLADTDLFVIAQEDTANKKVTWATVTSEMGGEDPIAGIFGTPDTAFEFDSTSLAGLTAAGHTPDVIDADTTVPGHLYINDNTTSAGFCARYASAPSAPFSVITKVNHNARENFNSVALFIGEASAANLDVLQSGNANLVRQIFIQRWTNATTYGSDITLSGYAGLWSPVYLAIVVNTSTDVDFAFSTDGYMWYPVNFGRNPSITIATLGVGLQAQNANGAGAAFDYLRVWESALTLPA